MTHPVYRLLIGSLLLATVTGAQATMRCNTHVIQEGALTMEVERKCGEPASREVFRPVADAAGNVGRDAATVEVWVYGPRNGMYRYLRFIEGKLVKIWSETA